MSVMVTAALSNILYTYYVSRLGPEALAAVSLTFPITLIGITAVGGGLGAGTSSAIARAFGREDAPLANLLAGEGFKLSIACGIAFGLLVYVSAPSVFALMGGRGPVLDQAVAFARVLFGGASISFLAATLDSIMRATGDSRTPAAWATASLALQVLLTPIFMFSFEWGLVGAAWATLAAQLLTVVPRFKLLRNGWGPTRLRLRFAPSQVSTTQEILRVAGPSALSTFSTHLGLLLLTGIVARFGNNHLAGYGLGTRLDFVVISLAYGFAVAVLTLVGMACGAQRLVLARRYILISALWTSASLGLLGTLLTVRPQLWLARFATDPEVLRVGAGYLHWVAPSYPFVGLSMICAFAFQGIGKASLPMLCTLFRVAAVVTASAVAVRVLQLPEWTIFACVAAGNVLSALVLAWLLRRQLRRMVHSGRP